MSKSPSLTVLLGPQTRLSLGINAVIRGHRKVLMSGGLNAMPSRMASPILRRAANARPAKERKDDFVNATYGKPTFLTAVNFFGPPHAGLAQREMFPTAETMLARLAEVAPRMRILMSVDTLPCFFLAAGSTALEERVQRTPWEALYDLSWSDLAREIVDAFPTSELVVAAPSAAGHADIERTLFGSAADRLPTAHAVLRTQVSETGRAVLDRLPSGPSSDASILAEHYASFAAVPSASDIAARLGIDKVTQALLLQRFEEDLDALRAMDGVTVLA